MSSQYKLCAVCGNQFTDKPGKLKDRIVCGPACANRFQVGKPKPGRPRVDHNALPCTGCGEARDCGGSRCRKCLAAYKRSRRNEDPEKDRLYQRQYAARNPDKMKEYAKRNYTKHTKQWIARVKKWGKEHPGKRVEYMVIENAKRRSRKAANGGRGYKAAHVRELRRRVGGVCAYCREGDARTVDHFVSLARGGLHDYTNLVPACGPCNSSKNDQDAKAWVVGRFGQERLEYVLSIMLKDD